MPWKKINNIPRGGEGECCVRGLLGVVSQKQKLIPSPHPSIYPNLSITASLQTGDRNSCRRRDLKTGVTVSVGTIKWECCGELTVEVRVYFACFILFNFLRTVLTCYAP